MKTDQSELTWETDYFIARQEGAVVVFSNKGNQLLAQTLLKAKATVRDYLRRVEADPEVRVVLLMPQPRKARREEYLSFFDMVQSERLSENSVMRLYRAVDQLILQILSADLFFISADCGQVLPLFASISLACDYHILGDNAVVQNPALERGLIPKGIAWFLSRVVGRARATELLLAEESISVDAALEMGLVNRRVPADSFEAEALAVANRFAALPETSLRLAKKLVNNSRQDLPDYLEFESQELCKTLRQIQWAES